MFTIRAKRQKGVAIYLTISIIAVLSSALLALISLVVSQIEIVLTVGDSVVAFYAADTGIERILYDLYKKGWRPSLGEKPYYQITLDGAYYTVEVSDNSPSTIYSTGTFKNTERKIEINF